MTDYLVAAFLGLIEGFTEFLPISSTGHLLIAQHWLGPRSDLFNIAIQSGAILAVLLSYRQRLASFLDFRHENREQRDYAVKLIGAFCITAALGLVAKFLGAELPDTVRPVAVALVVGGIAIILVERHVADLAPVSRVTWRVAIAVGVAQVVAGVFPGTSRSAAAIFAAMLFGLTDRPRAAEFAFLVGVPTMFAATGLQFLIVARDPGAFAAEDWIGMGIAFTVSAITGFATVTWLMRYVASHRFTVFGWYRIVLGVALIALLPHGAGVSGDDL
ncbi:MAG TPA: undecaprenyl-diphosphate phosphatase [Nevskiaceae bacterium]|nr:undecaprenyl-diphosphate phosphatase [Nevskiaceae bacterium]